MRVLTRFLRDRRAVAAVEFAIILPVMVLLFLGSVEIGKALFVHRKVVAVAYAGGDLVAQAEEISDASMADIFAAMDLIFEPYPVDDATYFIASVIIDPDDPDEEDTIIDWSDGQGVTLPADGDPFEVPDGLVPGPGNSVIVATVTYTYTPLFGAQIVAGDGIDMKSASYLRPRRVAVIPRCTTSPC
jgi:hypothetical protein